jgi:hypothetical protein
MDNFTLPSWTTWDPEFTTAPLMTHRIYKHFFIPDLPWRPPNLARESHLRPHPLMLLSNNLSSRQSTNCVIGKNLTFLIRIFKMFVIYFVLSMCFHSLTKVYKGMYLVFYLVFSIFLVNFCNFWALNGFPGKDFSCGYGKYGFYLRQLSKKQLVWRPPA